MEPSKRTYGNWYQMVKLTESFGKGIQLYDSFTFKSSLKIGPLHETRRLNVKKYTESCQNVHLSFIKSGNDGNVKRIKQITRYVKQGM